MREEASLDLLLVEDLEEDAFLTLRSLKKNKLLGTVKWVEDGEEALDFLLGTGVYKGRDIRIQPRIIMLDLKLPKLNGLQVLKEIRAQLHTRLIPTVIVSSSKEPKDLEQAYEHGASSYIVKPSGAGQIDAVVKELGQYWLSINCPPVESIPA